VTTTPVAAANAATAAIAATATTPATAGAERVLEIAATENPGTYTGPERRRSPRQAMRAKGMYRNELNPAAAGPVQILNFSMTGVRLWSSRPMKAGERGNVKMEIGPVKWNSRVKVITCEPQDDEGYAVGCVFAQSEAISRRTAA
jgi:hypothetical protein